MVENYPELYILNNYLLIPTHLMFIQLLYMLLVAAAQYEMTGIIRNDMSNCVP